MDEKSFASAAARFMIASRAIKNLVKDGEAAAKAVEAKTVAALEVGIEMFKKDPMAEWRGREAINCISHFVPS